MYGVARVTVVFPFAPEVATVPYWVKGFIGPVGPVDPVGPVKPVGPVGPVKPVGPVGPVGTIVSADNQIGVFSFA